MLPLKKVSVKNFRSIYNQDFSLENLTVVVGKNDSGKSNFLEVLRILLEGTPGDIISEDFYNLGEQIEITAVLSGARAYLPLCDDRNRAKIEQRIADDGSLTIRRIATTPKKLGSIEILNPLSHQFETPTGIDAAIRPLLPEVIFISALADVAEEAKGTQKDALGKLMGQIVTRIEEVMQPRLDAAYRDANGALNVIAGADGREIDERIRELVGVENEITGYIHETFPAADIRLKVALPSVKSILGSISVFIKESGQEDPYYRRGQGFQRSLYLSLLRALASKIRGREPGQIVRPFILLFEEPESFLHPGAQIKMRTALQTISEQAQVIYATHSPIMVTPDLLPNTIRLEKRRDAAERKAVTYRFGPISPGNLNLNQRQLLSLFAIQRSSRFLFSRGVLLVEGIGDEHLFPAMARRLRAFHLETHDIAIIEVGGKDNLVPSSQMLTLLGLKAWILTDLDFIWTNAGSVLGHDEDYAQFCQRLNELHPYPEERTEANLKACKLGRVESCMNELAEQRDALCVRLEAQGIFVLRRGEIEHYARLGSNAKSQYLRAAKEIVDGVRGIEDQNDVERVIIALEQWAQA